MTDTGGPKGIRHTGTAEAVVGFFAALLGMTLLLGWLRSAVYYDGNLVLLASYGVVWVPFLAAIVVASTVRQSRSWIDMLGLRISLIDVFIGIGFGLLARVGASLIEIAITGRMVGLGVTFGDPVYDGWWLFGTILAPVLLAPIIEELFFRGLLQRSVARVAGRRLDAKTSTAISVLASSMLFALLHVSQAANPTGALILGLTTILLGIAAGLIVAFTGRIGGPIVAHIVFNGALVLTAIV